jgi:hypothetical protein
LILGQYERVISSLESLLHGDLSALSVVIPFSLGCLVGLAAFSRDGWRDGSVWAVRGGTVRISV